MQKLMLMKKTLMTPFVDLCIICKHPIDHWLGTNNDRCCNWTNNKYMRDPHSPCVNFGCIPDLEYRHDNKPRGK